MSLIDLIIILLALILLRLYLHFLIRVIRIIKASVENEAHEKLEDRLTQWNNLTESEYPEYFGFPCKHFQNNGWCIMDRPELVCPCNYYIDSTVEDSTVKNISQRIKLINSLETLNRIFKTIIRELETKSKKVTREQCMSGWVRIHEKVNSLRKREHEAQARDNHYRKYIQLNRWWWNEL